MSIKQKDKSDIFLEMWAERYAEQILQQYGGKLLYIVQKYYRDYGARIDKQELLSMAMYYLARAIMTFLRIHGHPVTLEDIWYYAQASIHYGIRRECKKYMKQVPCYYLLGEDKIVDFRDGGEG